jgi:hypothetical protein
MGPAQCPSSFLIITSAALDPRRTQTQLRHISEHSFNYLVNIEAHFIFISGRTVKVAYGLGPLEHRVRGFEPHSRHECVSAFFCIVLSCVERSLEIG